MTTPDPDALRARLDEALTAAAQAEKSATRAQASEIAANANRMEAKAHARRALRYVLITATLATAVALWAAVQLVILLGA